MAAYVVGGQVFHMPGFAAPNTPVVGATVRIYDTNPVLSNTPSDIIFSGTTDTDGKFAGTTADDSVWIQGMLDLPTLSVVVSQDSRSWSFPAAVVATPVGNTVVLPPMLVPWGPGAITLETSCNPVSLTIEQRKEAIKLKAGVYLWAYDMGDGIANCKDPIPPEENNTPQFINEYTKVQSNGYLYANKINSDWLLSDPFDRLNDYRKLFGFGKFRAPRVLARYPQASAVIIPDVDFAGQRLAGANPMMLKRVVERRDIPRRFGDGFAVLRERVSAIANLAQLMTANRLYLADYRILGNPQTTGAKYMPSPFALFGVLDGQLKPLAIQIEREWHESNNPVFTPVDADRTMWDIAKIMVQVADFAVHELQYHLYETHLAMEPFAVAMARSMAFNHPIAVLLGAHFHGMIFKNAQARNYLIASGGPVESIIGLTLDASRKVLRRAASSWRFDQAALPAFLARRGLDDEVALPGYSYRDDALLIWETIRNFVTDYVGHCYASDSDVSTCDTELQDWLAEVRSPDGGCVDGVPDVTTREELVDVVTQIIFTCSAQHSAVNYAQYDYMAFVPNQPGSAYARPLPSAQTTGVTNLSSILPPANVTLKQTQLMWDLGTYRYDRLGTYAITLPVPLSTDVTNFQAKLADAEETIKQRNDARSPVLKYPYLLPSNIINSITV